MTIIVLDGSVVIIVPVSFVFTIIVLVVMLVGSGVCAVSVFGRLLHHVGFVVGLLFVLARGGFFLPFLSFFLLSLFTLYIFFNRCAFTGLNTFPFGSASLQSRK